MGDPDVRVVPGLGDRVRKLREMVPGLSAREAGRLLGLNEGFVSLIESGERPSVASWVSARIAKVFGVSLDWLILGKTPEPTARRVIKAVESARAELLKATG